MIINIKFVIVIRSSPRLHMEVTKISKQISFQILKIVLYFFNIQHEYSVSAELSQDMCSLFYSVNVV